MATDFLKNSLIIITILAYIAGSILFVSAINSKADLAKELANENKNNIKELADIVHNIDKNLIAIDTKLDNNCVKIDEIKHDIKEIKNKI